MKLHRSQSLMPPYLLTFEKEAANGMLEHVVASRALGISEIAREDFGLCGPAVDYWAELSLRFNHHPDAEATPSERVTLAELKVLGTALLHFSDRTLFELSGVAPPEGIPAASRRVQARMARGMVSVITGRGIRIDRLQPQSIRRSPLIEFGF